MDVLMPQQVRLSRDAVSCASTPSSGGRTAAFGILMGACLITAAFLYIPGLSVIVGQRDVVRSVHLIAGFLLPLPLIAGYAASGRFRRDVSRLNRFTRNDWRWLSPRRRGMDPVGKFNAGQKLNASFTLGSTLVMLATG